MNIFDLDNSLSWHSAYTGFIKNDPYWRVVEGALSREADDEIRAIMQGLENPAECLESAELMSLRRRCCNYFRETYSHVAAYHACRPTDIESYLGKGIIPSNMEALIEKAKIYFNETDAVTAAVKELGKDYLDHGRDKIGFFVSKTGSLESGYSHYLRNGSELFQGIARRLGDRAEQKISKEGKPTLFQCALPISWLDDFTTFPMAHRFALAPLVQLLIGIRWPEQLGGTIRGAFLLTRSVPKEYIIKTIDMTLLLNE